MEFRQLRYFVEIAAAGSLREASVRLRVAQPALTRHLRSLEEELGIALCARHARGVRLTPAGTRFVNHATAVLRQLDDIRTQVNEELDSPAGIVSIGAPGALGRLLFGAVAETIARDFPRIALRVVEGGAYSLLAALDARRVDLAVMVNPDARAGFTLEPLVTEPVYLVGAASDDRLPDPVIDIAQVAAFSLATFGRPSGPQKLFDHAAAKSGVTLRIAHELESLDVIKDFVWRGLAYALLPHSSIIQELQAGSFRASRVRAVGITRTLVMRETLTEDPAFEAVAKIIRQEVETLAISGAFGDRAGADTDKMSR